MIERGDGTVDSNELRAARRRRAARYVAALGVLASVAVAGCGARSELLEPPDEDACRWRVGASVVVDTAPVSALRLLAAPSAGSTVWSVYEDDRTRRPGVTEVPATQLAVLDADGHTVDAPRSVAPPEPSDVQAFSPPSVSWLPQRAAGFDLFRRRDEDLGRIWVLTPQGAATGETWTYPLASGTFWADPAARPDGFSVLEGRFEIGAPTRPLTLVTLDLQGREVSRVVLPQQALAEASWSTQRAWLADGSFLLPAVTPRMGATAAQLVVQHFGARGESRGPARVIAPALSAVAAVRFVATDGGWLAVWNDVVGASAALFVARLDGDGAPVGDPVQVSGARPSRASFPPFEAVATPDGALIVWVDALEPVDTARPTNSRVMVQSVTTRGRLRGRPVEVAPASASRAYERVQIAATPRGVLVVSGIADVGPIEPTSAGSYTWTIFGSQIVATPVRCER